MCIPKCILDSFGIRVKYMQNIKIHVFSWNITGHLRYILRYIRIHKGYMYPSGYMQDTCRIHPNTSGYVSDRKPPPKRIGNPPAPPGHRVTATGTAHRHGAKRGEGDRTALGTSAESRDTREGGRASSCSSSSTSNCENLSIGLNQLSQVKSTVKSTVNLAGSQPHRQPHTGRLIGAGRCLHKSQRSMSISMSSDLTSDLTKSALLLRH